MANIYRIFIQAQDEWQEIELDNLHLNTTFSVEEIRDISARKDTITKSITLKGTKQNNRVLGALYAIDRDPSVDEAAANILSNYKPNVYVDCFVLENNIQIIEGKLLITSISVSKDNILYDCNIVGKVFSFFSQLNERKMEELDYFNRPQYEGTLNFETIQDSWDKDEYPDYFFPFIDYGGSVQSEWNATPVYRSDGYIGVNHIRPAIYLKSYLDAVFNGWRYDDTDNRWTQLDDSGNPLNQFQWGGSIKNDTIFNRLFIPHNETNWTFPFSGQTITRGGYTSYNALYAIGINNTYVGYTVAGESEKGYINFYNNNVVYDSLWPNAASSPYFTPSRTLLEPYVGSPTANSIIISANAGGTFKIKARGSVVKSTLGGAMPNRPEPIVALKVLLLPPNSNNRDEGVEVYSHPIPYTATGNTFNFTGTITISGNVFNEESPEREMVGRLVPVLWQSENENWGGWQFNTDFRIILEGNDTGAPLHNPVPVNFNMLWGESYNIFSAIPKNILVSEFLKGVMLTHNLYITADKNSDNSFILRTYNEFYEDCLTLNREAAIDWTEKVDFKGYKIKSNINLPREYSFTYKQDSDTLNTIYRSNFNETYGNYPLTDATGFSEKKIVEMMFSPTILYKGANGINLPVIYSGDLGTNDVKPIKSNLRLMYYSGNLSVTNIRYKRPTGEFSDTTIGVINGIGDYVIESGNSVGFSTYPFVSMTYYNITNNQLLSPIQTLNFGIPLQSWSDDVLEFSDSNKTAFANYYQNQILELTDRNLSILEADVWLNEYDINTLDFSAPIYIQTPFGAAYFKLLDVNYIDATTVSKVTMQKIVLPHTNRGV